MTEVFVEQPLASPGSAKESDDHQFKSENIIGVQDIVSKGAVAESRGGSGHSVWNRYLLWKQV